MACPAPLFPDTVLCSGRGISCENNQCICEPGWIGQGDFVSGSPACHLNIVGVRVIWGFVLVGHSFTALLAAYMLISRTRRRRKFLRDRASVVGLVSLFTCSCLAALGFIRVTDPTRGIGTDPAATVLFALSSIGFWTNAPLMFANFGRLLLGALQTRNIEEKHRIEGFLTSFSRALPFGWFLAMIASISPMFILIDPENPDIMFGFALIHFVVLAFALFVCWFIVYRLVNPILRDLQAVLQEHPDAQLSSVNWKFHRFQAESRNQAMIQALSAGIFGCWPYAQRYSSYEVGIAWFGAAPILAVALITLMPTQKKQVLTQGSSNVMNGTPGALGTYTPPTIDDSFRATSRAT